MSKRPIIKLDSWIIRQLSVEQLISSYLDVVKELVENSIDAQAKLIRINIDFKEHSVEVIDDGIGMSEEDLLLCTESYSTSKFTDFTSLEYLGFRGEGLFAIKESADLEITSRIQSSLYGHRLTINNKHENSVIMEKVAANNGTIVKVKNLFFKTPSRRLFINSRTELIQIINLIEQLSISYFDIKFILFKNNKHIFTIGQVGDPIEQIFGIKEYETIYINGGDHKEDFFIKLIVNRNPKEKRGKILLFVNRRPVQDCGILSLIKRHIERQVGEKNLSFLLVFLTIDPAMINCNLVPNKNQIKLLNLTNIIDRINEFFKKPIVLKVQEKLCDNNETELGLERLDGWFVYENKFIFANYNNKVYVIDQHAISERILFNQLIEQKYESQLLLEKMSIKLSVEENLIMDIKENHLRELKFLFHRIDNYLLIYGAPEFINIKDVENTIKLFLLEEDSHLFLHKLSEYACKNSLKGGAIINEREILSFFHYLKKDSRCAFCNHGRNTTFVVEKSQIYKWFNIK